MEEAQAAWDLADRHVQGSQAAAHLGRLLPEGEVNGLIESLVLEHGELGRGQVAGLLAALDRHHLLEAVGPHHGGGAQGELPSDHVRVQGGLGRGHALETGEVGVATFTGGVGEDVQGAVLLGLEGLRGQVLEVFAGRGQERGLGRPDEQGSVAWVLPVRQVHVLGLDPGGDDLRGRLVARADVRLDLGGLEPSLDALDGGGGDAQSGSRRLDAGGRGLGLCGLDV